MPKIIFFSQAQAYQKLIQTRLLSLGWQVTVIPNLELMRLFLIEHRADLIFLDLAENSQEILEILDLIKTEKLPILSLVVGPFKTPELLMSVLESGATLTLPSPPSWLEIWLRLKNLISLQRRDDRPAEILAIGTHYFQEGLVINGQSQIKLRRKENRILECLTKYQHRVLNRDELMRYVWACPADYPSPDTIDVYIRRLRLKLGPNGKAIKTYRGFGYRWEPEV